MAHKRWIFARLRHPRTRLWAWQRFAPKALDGGRHIFNTIVTGVVFWLVISMLARVESGWMDIARIVHHVHTPTAQALRTFAESPAVVLIGGPFLLVAMLVLVDHTLLAPRRFLAIGTRLARWLHPTFDRRVAAIHDVCLQASRDHLEARARPGKDSEHWDGAITVSRMTRTGARVAFHVNHPIAHRKVVLERTVRDQRIVDAWDRETADLSHLGRWIFTRVVPATRASHTAPRASAHGVLQAVARSRPLSMICGLIAHHPSASAHARF